MENLTIRAMTSIQKLLTMVPEDPPRNGMAGWNAAMREEWDGWRQEAVLVMIDLSNEIGAQRVAGAAAPAVGPGLANAAAVRKMYDQAHRAVYAAPPGTPERARQLGIDGEE